MANRNKELTDNELNDRWAAASLATKQPAQSKPRHLIQLGSHLVEETLKVLRQSHGRITWRKLIDQVTGGARGVAPFFTETVAAKLCDEAA
jgi:hypothetical protein